MLVLLWTWVIESERTEDTRDRGIQKENIYLFCLLQSSVNWIGDEEEDLGGCLLHHTFCTLYPAGHPSCYAATRIHRTLARRAHLRNRSDLLKKCSVQWSGGGADAGAL